MRKSKGPDFLKVRPFAIFTRIDGKKNEKTL